jgi:hypothetical protein
MCVGSSEGFQNVYKIKSHTGIVGQELIQPHGEIAYVIFIKTLRHICNIFTINIDNMERRIYKLHRTLLDVYFVSYPVNKTKLTLMELDRG